MCTKWIHGRHETECNKRKLSFLFCAFGLGFCVIYFTQVPTQKVELRLANSSTRALMVISTVNPLVYNSTGKPLVINSTVNHLVNNSTVSPLVNNSTVNHLGFLDFQTDSDTLKQLITKDCKDNFLVPPLVHYVWLSKITMIFHEYVGILSARKFLKPCYILIHGDTIPGGKWWDKLLSEVKNIIHVQRKAPDLIFGKKAGYIEHKADLMRLEILLEYGGVYSDTDMYFLRSFDQFRNYELTLSRETSATVANGLIVANKESVMLRMWYLTYHQFNPDSWAENSVTMADKLCKTFPNFVHMEPGLVMLGSQFDSVYKENISWDSNRYSVHLYARYFEKRDFEIDEIKKLNNTFGSLTRFILFGKKDKG